MSDLWTPALRRSYRCRRLPRALDLSGAEPDPLWDALPVSEAFVDITGRAECAPRFTTRMRMGWCASYLYVRADLEETHVWGTITRDNEVMFMDNDFEVFLDPDGDGLDYYEFEINALGSIWELSLPCPYGDGGEPVLGCNLDGLVSRVRVDGTLNDPRDEDRGWSVEIAFPFAGLARYHHGGGCPPVPGDRWRVNFSRVQWRHEIVEGAYVRIPPHGTPIAESLDPEEQDHPEDNWVWSPQGIVNMHRPERWGEVVFE